MQKVVLVLMLGLLPLLCFAQQRIEVWTYHVSPPFILSGAQGLSHAFVELLNREPANHGRFRFELVELPRKRLDVRLAQNQAGILLWATPSFFTAAQTARGKWSAPLLMDQQDFVSLPDAPFDYEGSESLHGLVLGGVLGHRYQGLEDDTARGAIKRQDVHTDVQNFHKLLSGRINTLLISRSTLLYYRKTRDIGDLYISTKPLYQFTRHVLITDALDNAAARYLDEFLGSLPGNPQWQILLHHYGLEPMAARQER